MKALTILLAVVLLAAGCKSTRKTSTQLYTSSDSVSYTQVTTVDIDTTVIPADTAGLLIILADEPTGIQVEEVKTEQGDIVTVSYEVVKTGNRAAVKVQAVTRLQEVITTNTTTEITRVDVTTDEVIMREEKKVRRGISLWHLAWVVPVILIVFLARKFWPVISKYIGM